MMHSVCNSQGYLKPAWEINYLLTEVYIRCHSKTNVVSAGVADVLYTTCSADSVASCWRRAGRDVIIWSLTICIRLKSRAAFPPSFCGNIQFLKLYYCCTIPQWKHCQFSIFVKIVHSALGYVSLRCAYVVFAELWIVLFFHVSNVNNGFMAKSRKCKCSKRE